MFFTWIHKQLSRLLFNFNSFKRNVPCFGFMNLFRIKTKLCNKPKKAIFRESYSWLTNRFADKADREMVYVIHLTSP